MCLAIENNTYNYYNHLIIIIILIKSTLMIFIYYIKNKCKNSSQVWKYFLQNNNNVIRFINVFQFPKEEIMI